MKSPNYLGLFLFNIEVLIMNKIKNSVYEDCKLIIFLMIFIISIWYRNNI